MRVQPDIDVTGTFKMVKGDLRKQGYDLGQVDDPLFVMKPGESAYVPLDEDFARVVASGTAGY